MVTSSNPLRATGGLPGVFYRSQTIQQLNQIRQHLQVTTNEVTTPDIEHSYLPSDRNRSSKGILCYLFQINHLDLTFTKNQYVSGMILLESLGCTCNHVTCGKNINEHGNHSFCDVPAGQSTASVRCVGTSGTGPARTHMATNHPQQQTKTSLMYFYSCLCCILRLGMDRQKGGRIWDTNVVVSCYRENKQSYCSRVHWNSLMFHLLLIVIIIIRHPIGWKIEPRSLYLGSCYGTEKHFSVPYPLFWANRGETHGMLN